MGIQSGTEKRAALAYAASQGWTPLGEVVRNESEAGADAMRIADLERQNAELTNDHAPLCARRDELVAQVEQLEIALETERESHEVTKRNLLRTRGKGSAGLRIQALEKALAKLTGDDVTEDDLDAAKALLK